MTVVSVMFGYLYYHERAITRQQERALDTRVNELALTEMKLDSISRQLTEQITQVRQLGGNVKELERIKARLEADRAELRKGNIVLASTVKEYEDFLTKKNTELISLRNANKSLSSKNQELDSTNIMLQQERQLLDDSLAQVLSKTQDLEAKVSLAATLKARNLKVVAVSTKGKEREAADLRARQVDDLRVEFELEANPLAEPGTKRIYMKILDPRGATLSDASLGSGVLSYHGRSELFTLSKDVAYTNSTQKVNIIYNRTQPYQKGTYSVELFAEGQKIGEGGFSIR